MKFKKKKKKIKSAKNLSYIYFSVIFSDSCQVTLSSDNCKIKLAGVLQALTALTQFQDLKWTRKNNHD